MSDHLYTHYIVRRRYGGVTIWFAGVDWTFDIRRAERFASEHDARTAMVCVPGATHHCEVVGVGKEKACLSGFHP